MSPIVFDHACTGHRLPHARCLAHAADLAYKDDAVVEATARAWGFDRVRTYRAERAEPFPIQDTEAYVAAGDEMIIVAFRGTEPTEVRDWISDINAPLVAHQGGKGMAHSGFCQALDAVYADVRDTIREFRTNGQSLWFTGHSLGGALAMLAAARLYFEDASMLPDGVYTFGQPRTCDADLVRAYDEAFANRMYRFVNNNDIVAQVPPEPLYRHVEKVMYFDARGRLREEKPSLLGGLSDSIAGHTADPLAPGADALRDHFIQAYLANMDRVAAR